MNEILRDFLDKKICFKCNAAQSSKRTFCLRRNCRGPLRLRKAYKKR